MAQNCSGSAQGRGFHLGDVWESSQVQAAGGAIAGKRRGRRLERGEVAGSGGREVARHRVVDVDVLLETDATSGKKKLIAAQWSEGQCEHWRGDAISEPGEWPDSTF